MNILVTIYNPVDLFPPTINAIEQLSKKYSSVTLLTNGIAKDKKWIFPQNVVLHYIENWTDEEVKKSYGIKVYRFIKYLLKLRKLLKTQKYELVTLYESHAALAYNIATRFIHKERPILWYHNHDIIEMNKIRKYSLSWFAANAEQKMFTKFTIFSLPANERKIYFPLSKFTGQYFFLPNYPTIELYQRFYQKKTIKDELRLIYQGKISEGHGLEELITLLPEKINEKKLTLHIKGPSDAGYIKKLKELASFFKVKDQMFYYGLTSYSEVPRVAASCHIGIGIHTHEEIMHNTLGTSSNKIYEYAAAGLPVLLYSNEHFRKHLSKYSWACFTDCSKASLKSCIEKIILNYDILSDQAYKEFSEKLNFENYFEKVINFISRKSRQ